MRWQGREKSSNVDDRRRQATKVGGGIGIGAIIIYLIMTLLGQDPSGILDQVQAPSSSTTQTETGPRPDDELAEFVSVVLNDTEDVWNRLFPAQLNRQYQEPTLVLFDGQTRSACGFASAATGPFYCPADQDVYIDLSFYKELQTRFRAPGDFAMAYIVAHEVGHHIQYLLGITQQMEQQRRRLSKTEFNKLSVRLELQADFLAGAWAHHAQKMKNILEQGDIDEALKAAAAVGDDRIQRQARGYVVPESFTHGTSEQRMRWFRKGLETGDLSQGDTFGASSL
ncbi:KPN_02809 family neutral zinc metallopeptidase [Flavilitoribacter nigricans]|uniref:Metalloprotease n=1 Tax=Flavilitoribacter nigricans (strain ATCC 23147 / DSM 23189 / NBRC 102662 / NCIMB 1420 / SS-2) TaxID=1122177 RepID=A0A2D0NF62_FLAN2|nr:neutral zinc metallopeptidase [Flavilitoribacter nigricans]PHN07107.1 metalloprotease [Flavilitoribacter nigricans DSM 23189 = NBRC 102662]